MTDPVSHLGVSSTATGFTSHPHSITSWHQSYLPQWRDNHSKGLSRLKILFRWVSPQEIRVKDSLRQKNSGHISRWKWQTCVYTHGLTIEQKYVKSELKTPKRVTIEEKQWWKLMAIYRTWRQTDRHTQTYIHTEYKHTGIATSEGMQWNQSGE